ncbi:MAG: hypothetical protein A2589_00510 [Candidatus Vogelbacteria bacterium RIFOXYD1_FULL_46_19]|uniref:Uncharacterized protein n=1 Tax=Candidatus Vogelbacteria bacterium RIFOXYD1_FULL_46_19 TaxID=1802439 RepID=A0A1G2QI54_9BACT|nr:MAG: hypothetical protein A2589_00510 [Candidatus Vogelbacteria bacterium RIFOXYD1_FULL_46_19]
MSDENTLPKNDGEQSMNDPVTTEPTTPTTNEPAANPIEPENFKDKLEAARLAMEGPERTVKREEEETEKKVRDENSKLEKQLSFIGKQKEKLEINWVVLSGKQSELETLLTPIKQEEEKIELEEDVLEGEEHTTSDVTERQQFEKKRWAVQDKRKDLEKRKWELENKVLVIEADLKKNTDAYQKLLDEEDVINKQIENLEYEVQAAKEKVRLEEERQQADEQTKQIEAEQKRRQEAEALEADKRERARAELLARKKAEDEAKAAEQATAEKQRQAEVQKQALAQAQKNALEQKIRADLEMKRQEAIQKAKAAATPTQTTTPSEPNPNPKAETISIPNTGTENKAGNTPDPEASAVKIEGNISGVNSKTNQDEIDVPPFLPNETSDLPKLRTFKEDVAGQGSSLSPEQIKEAKKTFPWLK